MNGLSALFLAVVGAGASIEAPDPPVIAKMEEMGTVYLTRFQPRPKVKKSRRVFDDIYVNANVNDYVQKNAIIGVDFRPTAGSDPMKVAALVKELATLPYL